MGSKLAAVGSLIQPVEPPMVTWILSCTCAMGRHVVVGSSEVCLFRCRAQHDGMCFRSSTAATTNAYKTTHRLQGGLVGAAAGVGAKQGHRQAVAQARPTGPIRGHGQPVSCCCSKHWMALLHAQAV